MATQKNDNVTAEATSARRVRDLVVNLSGRQFTFKRISVPVNKCNYDPDNPRYRRSSGGNYTIEELVAKLKEEDDTENLARSIIANGDLIELPIAEEMADGTYKFLEGNRRLCAYRRAKEILDKKHEDSSKFDKIDIFVTPPEMLGKYVSIYIGFLHINSKREWNKFARVQYLTEIIDMYGGGDTGIREVSDLLGIKRSEIKTNMDALKLMRRAADRVNAKFSNTDEEKKTISEDMFYHYWELARLNKKDIQSNKDAVELALDSIEDNKFGDSAKIRQFPQIWANENARKVFKESCPEDAFEKAVSVLKEENPDSVKGGVFHKMTELGNVMESQWRDVINQLMTPDSRGCEIYWDLFECMLTAALQGGIQKDDIIQRVDVKLSKKA